MNKTNCPATGNIVIDLPTTEQGVPIFENTQQAQAVMQQAMTVLVAACMFSGRAVSINIGAADEEAEEKPTRELYDADPHCKHEVKDAIGGGIKCAKCPGWFCF